MNNLYSFNVVTHQKHVANVKKSIKFEAMSNKNERKKKKNNTGRISIRDYETSIPSSTMQSEEVI